MPKTALVTGASSGMGEEIARTLHKLGYTVYAAARRTDRLEKLTPHRNPCLGNGRDRR